MSDHAVPVAAVDASSATFAAHCAIADMCDLPLRNQDGVWPVALASRTTPVKLLAVDDEEEIGMSIAEMLAPEGHTVVVVGSARHALDVLKVERFDAIVSDVRMPGMHGLQLYRALVETRPDMAERIGFMTGDVFSGLSRRLREEAACPIMEKPFGRAELTRLVASILVGRRPGR